MMEDLSRRMKNIERGSEGSRGSVYGDRDGKRDEIDEDWVEERRENQQGWMKRVELPTFEGGDLVEWR